MTGNKYKIHLMDKFITLGMVALVSIVPLAYSSKVGEITLYPKFLVFSIIIFILCILWVIKLFTQKKTISFSSPLTLPIIFFLIINIVSLNSAVNIYASIFPLAKLFSLSILFFIIVNNITQKGIYLVMRVWACAGGIVSIIGIGQYLGLGFDWIPSAGNPSSTFGYRNIAAMFLIMTLPITGFLFIVCREKTKELFWGAIFTLLSIFLIYTRTRGAWLGITIGLIISLILSVIIKKNQTDVYLQLKILFKSRRKMIISLFALGVIVLSSMLDSNIKALEGDKAEIFTTVASIIGEGGNSGRFGLWMASWDMFTDGLNWLTGVGLNNWQFLFPAYAQGHMINFSTIVSQPHNDYLSILTEIGLIGFFVYLWILLTVITMVIKTVKYNLHPKTILLTLSLFTGFTAILIHSFFSFPKEHIAISMYFWLIIAFLTHLYTLLPDFRNHNQRRLSLKTIKNSEPEVGRIYYFIFTSMLIFSIISIDIGRRHFFSDFHFQEGFKQYYRKDYSATIWELHQAEELWYNSWKSSYLFGLTYMKLDNYSESIKHFKRCLSYSPYFLKVHYKLGIAYYKWGNYQEAIKHFAYTVTIYPEYGPGYYNLGLSWHKYGNIEEAENNYRRSIQYDPSISGAYNNLGLLLNDRGEVETARKYFEKAKENTKVTFDELGNIDSIKLLIEE